MTTQEYRNKFVEAFGYFYYTPIHDLDKLIDWFRDNPVPPKDKELENTNEDSIRVA